MSSTNDGYIVLGGVSIRVSVTRKLKSGMVARRAGGLGPRLHDIEEKLKKIPDAKKNLLTGKTLSL